MVRLNIAAIILWSLNVQALENGCSGEWLAYDQCMRKLWNEQPDDATGLPRPVGSLMTNLIISYTRNCLSEFNCEDILASSNVQIKIRSVCYPQLLKSAKEDLEICIRKDVDDFILPQSQFEAGLSQLTNVLLRLSNDALRHPSKYCSSSVTRDNLISCVSDKISTMKPSFPSTDKAQAYCNARSQCKGAITDECETVWQVWVREPLCKCADNYRLQISNNRLMEKYKLCAQNLTDTLSNSDNDDIVISWLNEYLNSLCSQSPAVSSHWNRPNSICDNKSTSESVPIIGIGSETTDNVIIPQRHSETTTPSTTISSSSTSQSGAVQSNPTTSPTDKPTDVTLSEGSDKTITYFFEKFTFPTFAPPEIISTTTGDALSTPGRLISNILGIKTEGGFLQNLFNFTNVANNLQHLLPFQQSDKT